VDDIKPGSYIYTNNPPVEIKGLMTLRDYFAAKAMQGVMARTTDQSGIARWPYEMADAMLKARMEKNHESTQTRP
jgi:hypothetical protein